jgi:hypothetical protein
VVPDAKGPDAEKAALQRIARRSSEPGLAYATDVDVVDQGFGANGTDPTAARFDMSADPLAFSRQRAAMLKTLIGKLEMKTPEAGEAYSETRTKFARLLIGYLGSFRVPGKYIGGLYATRAHRGDPGAPLAAFQVVPAAKQREALAFLRTGLFDANALKLSPTLLNRLAADKNYNWGEAEAAMTGSAIYSPTDQILRQQKSILGWLFTPGLLSRIRDNEARVQKPGDTLSMAELFSGMTDSIFSELRPAKTPVLVPTTRRELQREYVTTLLSLYQGVPGAPADAQSLARLHLRRLNAEITAALARQPAGKLDVTTRAHLEQQGERIQRALKAQAVVG